MYYISICYARCMTTGKADCIITLSAAACRVTWSPHSPLLLVYSVKTPSQTAIHVHSITSQVLGTMWNKP
jgi:hypothetical protein